MKIKFQKIKKVVNYTLYLIAIIIVTDVVLFKHILHYGYPSHFRQENIERYPAPYVEFTGKPNVADHNEFGFRGKSFRSAGTESIKIAFFGGSTGYLGNPTIAQVFESELQKLSGLDIFVANYSVVSSNHRQHLHAIIEYLPNFQPDIIVFYGGVNETHQYAMYDPRPGFPFNFFYKAELSPLKKILLENSAILGLLDIKFGIISGIAKLRSKYIPYSINWHNNIISKYFETIYLANKISSTIESNIFKNTKFYAFYQPYNVPYEFVQTHRIIKDSISQIPFAFDVSDVYLPLGVEIYTDICHVKQPANDLMGKTIAKIIFESAFNDMNGILNLKTK